MTRAIQPDRPPAEFKCRTCNTTWSSYMKNSILCTDITERNGLHDFDFAKPIIWIRFSFYYLSIWMNEVFENYKLSLQKRDQKPSKELVLLIRQSTKTLVKFGELWKQVQDRGYAEGIRWQRTSGNGQAISQTEINDGADKNPFREVRTTIKQNTEYNSYSKEGEPV